MLTALFYIWLIGALIMFAFTLAHLPAVMSFFPKELADELNTPLGKLKLYIGLIIASCLWFVAVYKAFTQFL